LRCLNMSMSSYGERYGASAWCLTQEVIGQELRKLYDPPMELPPRLLALARELGTMDLSPLAKELPTTLHALVRKLDALEGDQLLRRCNQRLRDLPHMDIGALT
jgi:hypothetical protein